MNYPKTLFIHGRPGPHPFHEALARSVNADLLPVDFLLRHHDRPTSRYYRYLSWLLCGICLPRRPYQVILCEDLFVPPVVAKSLGLLRRHQKIATLLSSRSLYFIKTKYYPAHTCRRLKKLLGLYDAFVCNGPVTTKLVHEYVPRATGIWTIHSGVSQQRAQALKSICPRLEGKRLLFIAHGPSGWRAWYKGIDVLFDTFARVLRCEPDVELMVVGLWDAEYRASLIERFPELGSRVQFVGSAPDLEVYTSFIASSSLCVHLARGDACPVSIIEVMAAGLPAMVSDSTGTYEAVAQVDPTLVVPLDPQLAADRILRYLRSSLGAKRGLSAACRQLALANYTQERSIDKFRAALVAMAQPSVCSRN